MKSIKILSLMSLMLFSSYGIANEVKDLGNGIYQQYLAKRFGYQVDSKTELCFSIYVMTGGQTQIECKDLAKREEWKSIITWEKG